MANRVFPAARLCLLGFYLFASFAKLNAAFFTRAYDQIRMAAVSNATAR